MFDSRKGDSQLFGRLAFFLCVFSVVNSAPGLEGSLATCSVEDEVIDLPILAGNPCFVCRCKNQSVECTREICPREDSCKGLGMKREKDKCCPVCQRSQEISSCTHQGKTFQNNASWFAEDCQICHCSNGTVSCELQRCQSPDSLKCPPGKKPGQVPGSCCQQCIEETGACTSYGDPHYQTFDGQMFNFHGTCRYQLTSDCANDKFSIRVRNEQRFSSVYAWSKALTIHLGTSVIVLQKYLLVKVNRSDVELPYYHLPLFQIVKESFMITMTTNIGLQVQWDGNGFIEIHVPKSFMGNVCGLCGNFNGEPKDDFLLRNGKRASSAREFGRGWAMGRRSHGCEKAPSPPVDTIVSKCLSRLRVYWRAHKRCWPIKKQFANCHKKVKPNAFYRSCISDVCQCSGRRCECESLMAYARACRREGVPVTWGRKNVCGVSCKSGAIFDDCVPACQRTCDNKDETSIPCPSRSCVPGCRCPAGTVWNSQRTKCIPLWKCPPQLALIQSKLRAAAFTFTSKGHHRMRKAKKNDDR